MTFLATDYARAGSATEARSTRQPYRENSIVGTRFMELDLSE